MSKRNLEDETADLRPRRKRDGPASRKDKFAPGQLIMKNMAPMRRVRYLVWPAGDGGTRERARVNLNRVRKISSKLIRRGDTKP